MEGGKSAQLEAKWKDVLCLTPEGASCRRTCAESSCPQECCLHSWLRVLFALSAGKLRVTGIITPSLNYVTFLSAMCHPPMQGLCFLSCKPPRIPFGNRWVITERGEGESPGASEKMPLPTHTLHPVPPHADLLTSVPTGLLGEVIANGWSQHVG